MEHLSCEGRQRELGLFSPQKKRLHGDLVEACQYLNSAYRKARACSDKTRGNGFKLKEGRFRLDIRKIIYCEGGEALEQVAQRSCECPLPGSVQGQAGWGFHLV